MAAPRNLLLVSDDHVPYRDDLRWTVLETIRRLSPAVLEDLGARSWPKPGPAIPRSAPSSRGQSNASRQTGSTTARSSPISPFPIPKNLTTRSRLHWRGRTVALEEYLRQAETHYNAGRPPKSAFRLQIARRVPPTRAPCRMACPLQVPTMDTATNRRIVFGAPERRRTERTERRGSHRQSRGTRDSTDC